MINFPGWLMSLDKKSDDERADAPIILEVTSVKSTGEIEITFDDRNEAVLRSIQAAGPDRTHVSADW